MLDVRNVYWNSDRHSSRNIYHLFQVESSIFMLQQKELDFILCNAFFFALCFPSTCPIFTRLILFHINSEPLKRCPFHSRFPFSHNFQKGKHRQHKMNIFDSRFLLVRRHISTHIRFHVDVVFDSKIRQNQKLLVFHLRIFRISQKIKSV